MFEGKELLLKKRPESETSIEEK